MGKKKLEECHPAEMPCQIVDEKEPKPAEMPYAIVPDDAPIPV
jgi:hypothetical protein